MAIQELADFFRIVQEALKHHSECRLGSSTRPKLTCLTGIVGKLVNADIPNTELGGAALFGMGLKSDNQQ